MAFSWRCKNCKIHPLDIFRIFLNIRGYSRAFYSIQEYSETFWNARERLKYLRTTQIILEMLIQEHSRAFSIKFWNITEHFRILGNRLDHSKASQFQKILKYSRTIDSIPPHSRTFGNILEYSGIDNKHSGSDCITRE